MNDEQLNARWPTVLSVGIAILALFLAILALGRALARDASVTVDPTASDDGPASGGPAPVSLTEFAITPADLRVGEGASLAVSNDGAAVHNLTVQDADAATADLDPGGSGTLDLSALEAGGYTLFCSIPGHEAAGMVGTLTVGEGEVAAPPEETHLGAEALRANYEASVGAFPAETSAKGNQPLEPEVLDDGTKVFTLTIDETEWEVEPGKFVETTAYNGQVPGPRIEVEVGDTIKLVVNNELDDQATTLHPHGVFLHPLHADGVGMISMDPIMPGESWDATFVTQQPAVGMYHGHDNGVHQVPNGAFGVFLVGDLPLPPEADNVVGEYEMVLNDAGNIGLTLNGKSFPATEPYALKQGEQLIMHYYNEGLSAHPMHLHNNRQLVIAKDGYPLASPYSADTVNVAPGERYTVVVFAEEPGTWVWHCHILTHVEKTDGSVFGMFTALIVDEPAVEPDAPST